MSDAEDQSSQIQSTALKVILIVEDEAAIGDLLVETIARETPHRAILVADSTRAFNVIQRIKPNLVLLDYHLPGMNGIELYDQLRAIEGLEDLSAILMTAGVLQHDMRRRKIVGMSKPIDINKLLDLIEELLAEE
jgi:CheY-like chemotaxis protein